MLVELFGTVAAASLVVTYGLEARSARFVLGFAGACIAVALYALATEAWLFAPLELIWAGIAIRRWRQRIEEEAI
jgi:hypothetical protein